MDIDDEGVSTACERMANEITSALTALRTVRTALRFARIDAQTATDNLAGARAARAAELAEKICECLHHCEHLAFNVTGDLREPTGSMSDLNR